MGSNKVWADQWKEEIARFELLWNFLIEVPTCQDFSVKPFDESALAAEHREMHVKAIQNLIGFVRL